MTLIFIGLGLHDGRGISIRGVEIAKKCDLLFAEFYTTPMPELDLNVLESLLEKKIKLLGREEIENAEVLLQAAKNKAVGLLVGGDPMAATTHIALRLEAMKRGIACHVVHAESILTAAASLAGLQHYKFGRTITIPWPRGGYFPLSPYTMLAENVKQGRHTLILLDTEPYGDKNKIMTANDAIDILLEMEKTTQEGAFLPTTEIFVLGKVGSLEPYVVVGSAAELRRVRHCGPPHTLIVPGKLHFMEEEFIKLLRKKVI